MSRKPHFFTILLLLGALTGLLFSAVSTGDFAQHLDRQMHSVSCSFVPVGDEAGDIGQSDCRTTMFSEYSSVFRDSVWGGIPISLPAMSVFVFLLLFAGDLVLTRRQTDARATGFLALATALPASTSLIMAFVSLSKLDAACKLCIGIYLSSALVLIGGIGLWRRAVSWSRSGRVEMVDIPAPGAAVPNPGSPDADPAWVGGPLNQASALEVADIPQKPPQHMAARPVPKIAWSTLGAAFALGVLFVVLPVVAYAKMAPEHSSFIGTCGSLPAPEDTYKVLLDLDSNDTQSGVPEAIEVLDPLCPACLAFEKRLESAGFADKIHRRAVLFPLDSECNWMVDDRVHPGACAISEAVLCAGPRAKEVVRWAFDNQESITLAAAEHGDAARTMAGQKFPDLAKCIGSAGVKSKLNKSLRWAVANQLPVLTPQLYVNGVKLCDEDTDLGLEYQLGRMLSRQRAGTLRPVGAAQ